MAQPFPAENIEAHIQGEISGQVAIGNNIIQIGSIHGGVVNIVQPEQQPRPQPRPSPIFLRPRPFPGLLDREAEINAASAALQSALPVEFHGQAGLGKTTLLRHLAYHPADTSFPDGVIYLSARHQPVADLLQSLFDAFYESDAPFKPTDAQVRHALQGKQALILLDDVNLARDEVEALMDAAPGCTFLLASSERRLWGEGRAMALHGLPSDDALALVERELGRPLTPEERPAAQALCTALECHPLRLLQAAAMAREEGRSLAEVAVRLSPSTMLRTGARDKARRTEALSPTEMLTAEALNSLQEPEQQVLAALATLGGASLPADLLDDCDCGPCEMEVYAEVTDPSGVAGVKLVYKGPKETTWQSKPMTNTGGTSYRTTLNPDNWNWGTLEFYVLAYDNRGNPSESLHLKMDVHACVI